MRVVFGLGHGICPWNASVRETEASSEPQDVSRSTFNCLLGGKVTKIEGINDFRSGSTFAGWPRKKTATQFTFFGKVRSHGPTGCCSCAEIVRVICHATKDNEVWVWVRSYSRYWYSHKAIFQRCMRSAKRPWRTCPSAGLFLVHHLLMARSTSARPGPRSTCVRAKARSMVRYLLLVPKWCCSECFRFRHGRRSDGRLKVRLL